ncbi:DMT family transporter [Vagococcus intermedius]|uniref:Multidrug efflux SMR transporter n=1 Tax=Vagococcus intermedius TaxID=2991418 RepID=A0AAF0CWK2_9ENTE|nr:multidrug efflux SMR transporter [Vagococcus intermedius]WEG74198.1 multidrug efflux SMR transporter [Vagococcus intermedius]WEG76279.1 multidrug efflux SMR transporter [Vagococcus intermedius]
MKIAFYLGGSILFEVLASSSLKLTRGFTKLLPSVLVVVSYAISFFFLSLVLQLFPLGGAYAIWGGIGTILTCLIGVLRYHEPLNFKKISGIGLIILGVIVLNLYGGVH